MTRLWLSLAWLAAALGLILAAPALAGVPVTLKSDLSSGPVITLGDLFDDAGDAAQVAVGHGAPVGLDAVLDSAEVQTIAHIHGLDWTNPSGQRRIIVRAVSVSAPSISAGVNTKMVEVLAYGRSLAAGEMIRPEDLTFTKVPAFAAPTDAPRDASDVIGKVARQPLRSGSAVQLRDVSNAQVIKRNDLVQVTYQADGITLVLQAKALGGGAVGDMVGVLNTTSNKTIQAVAVGPDQAVVGPEAVAIKAAAYPYSAQFAENR